MNEETKKTCVCPGCGHKHVISEREIGMYVGLVRALWQVFKWCEQKSRHAFHTKEVDGEKVYFFEPLEKVISVKDLQKILNASKEIVNKLKTKRTI